MIYCEKTILLKEKAAQELTRLQHFFWSAVVVELKTAVLVVSMHLRFTVYHRGSKWGACTKERRKNQCLLCTGINERPYVASAGKGNLARRRWESHTNLNPTRPGAPRKCSIWSPVPRLYNTPKIGNTTDLSARYRPRARNRRGVAIKFWKTCYNLSQGRMMQSSRKIS